jgi:hypothetical protein
MKRIRKLYLDRFKQSFESYRTEKGESAFSEITLLIGKPNEHDDFFRTYVFDAISKNKDGSINIVEFNIDPEEGFYDKATVSASLCWNAIEFRCYADQFSVPQLIEWGRSWMDDSKPKQGPQDGLTGVIHSVTAPGTHDKFTSFSVDFGSAPIAALDELVQLLGEQLIEIGSFAMTKEDKIN